MSVNYVDKSTGDLIRVAGQGKAEYGASTVRKGTFTGTDNGTGLINITVTFDSPMPDADYLVDITDVSSVENFWVSVAAKTKNGFALYLRKSTGGSSITVNGTYTAFKLYTDTEYNNLLNNAVLTSDVTDSVTNGDLNPVTSNAVYDAIKNASSVFIGTSSEWESEVAKTDYQVAILTDEPNVNAVDNTDGSTTVVGEPNKRWSGTTEEWEQFETDYPEEAARIEVRFITDDSETGSVVDAVEDGNMKAVTSNAVYEKFATNLKVAKYFLGASYTSFNLTLDNPTENSGMLLVGSGGEIFTGTINFLHQGTFTNGNATVTCTYNPSTKIAAFSGAAFINTVALWYC